MNKERLLKLADFIETVPDKHFNMDVITTGNAQSLLNKEPDCGTAACCIGWLPVCFKEHFVYANNTRLMPDVVLLDDIEVKNWTAVDVFFDLDFGEADYLFDPCSYCDTEDDDTSNISKCVVAQRIRDFVGTDGVIPHDSDD